MRRLAEHGRKIRCVRGDVGRHHHDIARLQRRIVREKTQQRILERFELAQARGAGVHAQARIRGRRGNRFRPLRLAGTDAILQTRKQIRGLRRAHAFARVEFDAGAFQRDEEILRHAPERNQQRMANLEMPFLVDFAFAQKLALRFQVGPVFAARIGKIKVHRAMRRHGTQCGEYIGRQMADPEHVQRLGCAVTARGQRFDNLRMPLRAMRPGGYVLAQAAPERALPVLGAAFLPILDPVRPVDQVLGVDAGQTIGQLETPPLAVVGIDQTLHARVVQRRQQRVDVPAQILFFEAGIGFAAKHASRPRAPTIARAG